MFRKRKPWTSPNPHVALGSKLPISSQCWEQTSKICSRKSKTWSRIIYTNNSNKHLCFPTKKKVGHWHLQLRDKESLYIVGSTLPQLLPISIQKRHREEAWMNENYSLHHISFSSDACKGCSLGKKSFYQKDGGRENREACNDCDGFEKRKNSSQL